MRSRFRYSLSRGQPLVVSVTLPRFPFAKTESPFATGGPRVRILLPPAESHANLSFRAVLAVDGDPRPRFRIRVKSGHKGSGSVTRARLVI